MGVRSGGVGMGRSPRGRRSLMATVAEGVATGSISARAEEPPASAPSRSSAGVDLRAGGGAAEAAKSRSTASGRSPRGRRSRRYRWRLLEAHGSISARAEEPYDSPSHFDPSRVDLRAGGGALTARLKERQGTGRSPRGRRSLICRLSLSLMRVDLRAGGGAGLEPVENLADEGRSPRGRRSPEAGPWASMVLGSISARAEEPQDAAARHVEVEVDLRAGGGALGHVAARVFLEGRSPRGRRSHTGAVPRSIIVRSISARAEEPRCSSPSAGCARVDLRAGGGAGTRHSGLESQTGRSPRGRRSLSRF